MKVIVKSNLSDIKKFAGLVPDRKKHFENGSTKPLPKTYRVNEIAKLLHPEEQLLKVVEIEDIAADVKCYTFESASQTPLAYSCAGQYISLRLKIGESCVTRPYSLASSPKESSEGKYKIAVKRVNEGFVSGYILDNFEVGTVVAASAPEGNFCYEPLRDAPTVVGIAGGSGITPFLALAKSIADGKDSASLILLYGVRTENDILFKNVFDELAASCDKIKVVYVLSHSEAQGFEHGFITKELILKYAPETFSVFLCGPGAMYDFVGKQLEEMKLRKKFIRFELFGEIKQPQNLAGFPVEAADKVFSCTVINRGEVVATLPCKSTESILVCAERGGLTVKSSCRSGECGFCRCKLVSGEVFIPDETEHRREGDIKYGYIHPCCTYPVSDITISL